ncbi:macro domain-containing protein [Flammeovirga sp. OC4]|uniref:macro domain-containing protein n=1 Tax=Flammeovirga sp. OC4 TaxID=1382345 RepID=UPI000694A024|nr:macro domain-containing protein [Flammeovirga sp. OC4]
MTNNKTYYIGGSQFNVLYADITTALTDVIVSSDDTNITMSGGVSRSILKAGSHAIQVDARKHKGLKVGDIVVSTAGHLHAKYIFHAITLNKEVNLVIDPKTLELSLKRILELGKALRVRSIALPAIATGTAGYDYKNSIKAITEVIGGFLKDNDSIEEVNLCLLKRDEISREQMNTLFENAVELVSIKEQNQAIKSLLEEANESLKQNDKVDTDMVEKLEEGLVRISSLEKEENGIVPTKIPELLSDLSLLYDLLHSVNSNKHEIEQLKEDKKVLEQSINYHRTALRHYEIEKAKYGGEMLPFRLVMSIEDAEKEINSTQEKINSINSQLKSFLELGE